MISYLEGVALTSSELLTASGVGYTVRYTGEFTPGERHAVWVTTHVRENAITLYAFDTTAARAAFDALCGVNQVGPAVALAVLRDVGVETLAGAVAAGDPKPLTAAKGVGAKAAERIVSQVKLPDDVLELADDTPKGPRTEVLAVLVGLGYDETVARDTLDGIVGDNVEDLLNDAIARLAIAA